MMIQAVQIWLFKSYFCSSSPVVKRQAVLLQFFKIAGTDECELLVLHCVICQFFAEAEHDVGFSGIELCSDYIVLRFFVSFLPINVNELYELSFKKRG